MLFFFHKTIPSRYEWSIFFHFSYSVILFYIFLYSFFFCCLWPHTHSRRAWNIDDWDWNVKLISALFLCRWKLSTSQAVMWRCKWKKKIIPREENFPHIVLIFFFFSLFVFLFKPHTARGKSSIFWLLLVISTHTITELCSSATPTRWAFQWWWWFSRIFSLALENVPCHVRLLLIYVLLK